MISYNMNFSISSWHEYIANSFVKKNAIPVHKVNRLSADAYFPMPTDPHHKLLVLWSQMSEKY